MANSSGSGLDTGTGGFPVGDSQDLNTFDVGVAQKETGTWSPGQVKVDKTVKDLSPGTMTTLANYLSETTLGKTPSSRHANRYPVRHDTSETLVALKLETPEGNTPPLTQLSEGSQPHYVDSSLLLPFGKQYDVNLKKGRSASPATDSPDGNTLLYSTVAQNGLTNPPKKGTVNLASSLAGSLKSYFESVFKFDPTSANFSKKFPTVTVTSMRQTDDAVNPLPVADKVLDTSSTVKKLSADSAINTYSIPPSETSLILLDATRATTPLTNFSTNAQGDTNHPHFVDSDKLMMLFGRTLPVVSLKRGLQDPDDVDSKIPVIDGNKLFSVGVQRASGIANPPVKGTVNFVSSLKGTLKSYTQSVVGFDPVGKNFQKHDPDNGITVLRSPEDLPTSKSLTDVQDDVKRLNEVTDANSYEIPSETTVVSLSTNEGYVPPLNYLTQDSGEHFIDTQLVPGGRSSNATKLDLTVGKSSEPTASRPDGHGLLLKSVTRQSTVNDPPPVGEINLVKSLNDPIKKYLGGFFNVDSKKFFDANVNDPLVGLDVKFKDIKTPTIILNRDISVGSRATLGDYLNNSVSKNSYNNPIDTSGYGLYNVGLLNLAADNSQASTPSGGGMIPEVSSYANIFVKNTTFVGRSQLAGDDKTGFRLDKTPGDLNTKQTSASGDSPQIFRGGHTLLVKATTDGEKKLQTEMINPSVVDGKLPVLNTTAVLDAQSIAGKYSLSLLKNRFNPDAKWDTGSGFARKYNYGTSRDDVGDNASKDFRSYTQGRLKNVGISLMLRASTEIGSSGPDTGNPTSTGQDLASMLPGGSQLAIYRPNASNLEAKRVLEEIANEEYKGAVIGIYAGGVPGANNDKSWGALNNPQDLFSGFSAFGMQLLAIAIMLAMVIVLELLNVILSLFPGTPSSVVLAPDQRRPFGANEADPASGDYGSIAAILKQVMSGKFNLWRALGFASTRNDMTACMPIGMFSFFGVEVHDANWSGLLKNLADAAMGVAATPGYYTVIARAFMRSFLILGSAFESLSQTNPITGATKLLTIIFENFKESKLMKTLNLFCQMGDNILTDLMMRDKIKSVKQISAESLGTSKRHASFIDLLPNETSGMKSRLNVESKQFDTGIGIKTTTLAWSSQRARDLFLMPKSVFGMRVATASSSEVNGIKVPAYFPINQSNSLKGPIWNVSEAPDKSRLSTDQRAIIENSLEAEYLPFYFHDIRTNEIISFHAFLASLSDDYTAAYDSVDAFGRVEPVKTYKGTHRKIGFSFYIVATSPADFDVMWLKINKLTTLVYPQFTEGRSVTVQEGYNVTAPFSQMIQAAPMIRVRIGDLVRSNYSKFNLARLFGLGTQNTQFGKENPVLKPEENDFVKDTKSIQPDILQIQKDFTYICAAPLTLEAPPAPKETGLGAALASAAAAALGVGSPPKYKDHPRSLPSGFVLKATNESIKESAYQNKGLEIVEVIEASGDDITEVGAGDGALFDYYKAIGFVNKRFYVHKADLIPTRSTRDKLDAAQFNVSDVYKKYMTSVGDFMQDNDPSKGNAVVRSFKTVGGRGLAGFIETMNFDWYDRTTWEIGHGAPAAGADVPDPARGRRAPKSCKVTISFTPVHDITPGIDHMGFNRAPIYPVGPMYSKDQ